MQHALDPLPRPRSVAVVGALARPGSMGARSLINLEPVGNTVNLEDASFLNTIGDSELRVVWEDPDFDPNHRAVYYARVLEIPTPTWQAYDAATYGVDMPEEIPMVHQERAYSSPIWYTPER